MKKFNFTYIIFILYSLFLSTKNTLAGSIYDKDTTLSPPVGSDVLPGSRIDVVDIKKSFIFEKTIPFIIDYSLKLAISLSVIVIIIGGYQFLTAYGDTEKQQTARKTITYALIGLVLSMTAYGVVAMITSIRLS